MTKENLRSFNIFADSVLAYLIATNSLNYKRSHQIEWLAFASLQLPSYSLKRNDFGGDDTNLHSEEDSGISTLKDGVLRPINDGLKWFNSVMMHEVDGESD